MFDLGCQAGQAVSGWFDGMVAQVADGAAEFVVTMSGWWVRSSSVNVTDPAVMAAHEVTGPLVGVILVASVLVQAIRIMISRKGEGLVFIVTGLLRYAATAGMGLVLLQTALAAADALATEILDDAVTRYAEFMRDVLVVGGGVGAFPVLLVSIIAGVLALIQYLLMAVRQAGLLVLAAMLPLAASGSLTRSTRGWLERLIPWLIALVCYKPAAALIYYVGFAYVSSGAGSGDGSGDGSGELSTMLTGLMVLLLAVVAMPVMLRFFSWSGIQIGGASGGSGLLGAAGAIANTRMYMGGRAVQRAAALEATGPGSRGSTPGSGGADAAGAAPGGGRAGSMAGRRPVGGGTRLAGAGIAGAAGAAVGAGGAAVRAAGRGMAGPPSGESSGGGTGGDGGGSW